MKRFTAGLAVSALAASAVLGVGAPAIAASPTCTASALNPAIVGGEIYGQGQIHCTVTATFTLTVKLWRNDGDGSFSHWSRSWTEVGETYGQDVETACVAGAGTRQWHTEAVISWKIYDGSNLQASGSGYDNSSDVNINCH